MSALSFRYRDRTVLTEVTLECGAGVTVVLGRNGAGKTTLLRIVAGALVPAHGEVRLAGRPLRAGTRAGRALLRDVGWLPQEFGYPSHIRVAEFVAYAAWLKKVPSGQRGDRVAAALAAAGVTPQADRPMAKLSGGQRRRVGLAAAVVAQPHVLVLDEPTAGLDPEQRGNFHTLVREHGHDTVVVVATHLLEDVAALADHVVVLDAGRVCWSGPPEALAGAADDRDQPSGDHPSGGHPPVEVETLRRGLAAVSTAAGHD